MLTDLIRGRLTVSLRGGDIERFLSLSAARGLRLSSLSPRKDGSCVFFLPCRSFSALRVPARRTGVRLHILRKEGLPFLLRPLFDRPGLWGGAVLSLALLYGLSLFLWSVEVTGVSAETAARVRSFLAHEGLHVGAFLPSVDAEELKSRLLIAIDELDWAAVNLRGVKATVEAVESPQKPADRSLSPSSPADLIAGKDGVLLFTHILRGEQLIFPGAAVKKGEIIASHEVHGVIPGTNDLSGAVRYVHAAGVAIARREGHITACLPSERLIKVFTGRNYRQKRLLLADIPIKFSKSYGNPYANSDIIEKRLVLSLPGGRALPLTLEETHMAEYSLASAPYPAARAAEELQRLIETHLLAHAVNGQIEALDCVLSRKPGFYQMDAEYIITEDIGEEMLISP